MIYGVTFNRDDASRHTYTDWGLLQVGTSYVSPPVVQTRYINVPGMDGFLDATEALDGMVHYNSRKFVAKYKCIAPRDQWPVIYSDLMNFIHGRQMHATFDDDDRYYINGRFEVGAPAYQKYAWTVDITGEIDPYKYMLYDTIGEWEWDPFRFATDIAWDYKDIEVSGMTEVLVSATPMPVSPTFTCSAPLTLHLDGKIYNLPAGVSTVPGLVIKDRDYSFQFSGTGTVTIYFRGGKL